MLLNTRTRLLLLFVFLVFLLTTANSFYSYYISKEKIIEAEASNLQDLIQSVATAGIDSWINTRLSYLEMLAADPLLESLDQEEPVTLLLSSWQVILDVTEDVFFLYAGDLDDNIQFLPPGELPSDYTVFDRPWYMAGMDNAGVPTWIGPYTEAVTGEQVVSIVKTFPPAEDNPQGVMAVDVSLECLQNILASIALPPGAELSLFDQENNLIAASVKNPAYEEIWMEMDQYKGGFMEVEGMDALFVASKSINETPWTLALFVPRQHFFSSILPLRFSGMVVGMIALLLAILIIYFMFRNVAGKTEKLVSYFQEAVGEKFSPRMVIEDQDEFMVLNKGFNQVINDRETAESRFAFLFANAPVGIFYSNPAGEIETVNDEFARIYGYQDAEEFNKEISSMYQLYVDRNDREILIRILRKEEVVKDFVVEHKNKDGNNLWISINALLKSGKNGKIAIEGFVLDVTRRVEGEKELRTTANTDELTGLWNRRGWQLFVHKVVSQEKEYGKYHLLICDLDRFKRVNDAYGHGIGDMVLKNVATLMRQSLRQSDIIARIGGEEFAVLLSTENLQQACKLAERVRQTIANTPTIIENQAVEVTISIGVSAVSNGDDMKAAFQRADRALYKAKKKGRNVVCVAESPEADHRVEANDD